ncbi:MAG TPA: hypothetical protein VGK73_21980 [Polyangiaceae bacterium]
MYEHISALQASVHHWVGLASDFFLYEHWDGPWFEKDSWEKLTKGTRIFLCMAGALLLIYEVRARRLREKIKERTRKRIAYVLTGLAFFVYFDFFNPNVRYEEYYHRHEFYHYYLGSKYSQELGYLRLYECTMIAEIEAGRKANVLKREVRDLRENLIKPVEATYIVSDPAQCTKHFSKPRWEEFKQDIEWFQKSAAGSYWEGMQKDHGYNPPPVWTMTGKLFGSFAPAGDTFFKLLACIDILFHVGIVLMFGWAFGWRAMAVATIFWGCNAPANFYWTGGAFLRMDWIFLLVASLCLLRKRRFFMAGFALTWAMLLRIFPGLFIAGVVIIIALHVIDQIRRAREGKGPKKLLEYIHPDHRRFIAGCCVSVGVLIPASIMVTGGTEGYKDFYEHTLKTHQGTPLTNTMGLQTMLVHDWKGRMRFTRDDNMDDPFQGWKQGRLDRFQQMKPVFIGIIAFVFAWTVWALRRTKLLWVGLAISTPLVICLTNVTCYYYSMCMVSCALVIARRQIGPPMLITSGVSQILLYAPNGYYWVDDRYTAQSWLFFTMSIILLFVYSRPFSMERLKLWWARKPEPKDKWKIFVSTPPAKPTPAE